MTMGKRHVIFDKTLGLDREYTSVYSRNAREGEYIVPITDRPPYYVSGDYGLVERTFRHEASVKFRSNYEGVAWSIPHESYAVLEPTKYVVIEDVTYRLSERKAEVGDSIVAKDAGDLYKNMSSGWRKGLNPSPIVTVLARLPRSCVIDKVGKLLPDGSYYVLDPVATEEDHQKQAKLVTRCFMCEKELYEGDIVRIHNITTYCSATCVADAVTYTEVLMDK